MEGTRKWQASRCSHLEAVLVTGLNVYVSQGRYWPFSHKRTNKSSGWTNRLAFVCLMRIYVPQSLTCSSWWANRLGKIVFSDAQISDDLFVEKFVRPTSDDLFV